MRSLTDTRAHLRELKLNVEAELKLAESSRPEEIVGLPSTEWPFDPMDVQREEVSLRSLLGAVEAMEDDRRDNDRDQDESPSAPVLGPDRMTSRAPARSLRVERP